MNEEERRKETKDQAIPHQSDCPLPPTQTTRHKRELGKKTTTTANSSFTVDWGQLSGLKRNFSEADAPQLQISDSMWSDSPVKVQKISFQPPKRPRLLNSLNKSWFSATILRLTIVVSKSSNSATFSFFLSFFPLSCFFLQIHEQRRGSFSLLTSFCPSQSGRRLRIAICRRNGVDY